MNTITRRAIADRRRWLAGWTVGIAGLALITISFWPALKGRTQQLNDMMSSLPESVKALIGLGGDVDPFSPLGYLLSKVFAFMLPLLLLIAGMGLTAGIAGDEEHGLMETTFSLPASRRQVLLQRWWATMFLTTVLAAGAFVIIVAAVRIVSLDVSTGGVLWGSLAALVLTWAVCAVTLAVGAATGRRGLALTVGTVLAVAGYLVTSLAEAGISFFHSIRVLSVFTHYDITRVIVHGRPTPGLAVLAGITIVGVALALWWIDRRDLRAG